MSDTNSICWNIMIQKTLLDTETNIERRNQYKQNITDEVDKFLSTIHAKPAMNTEEQRTKDMMIEMMNNEINNIHFFVLIIGTTQ